MYEMSGNYKGMNVRIYLNYATREECFVKGLEWFDALKCVKDLLFIRRDGSEK